MFPTSHWQALTPSLGPSLSLFPLLLAKEMLPSLRTLIFTIAAATLMGELGFGLGVKETAAEEPVPIKNVLFLVADDLKASVLGCYGDQVCKTPNLDRLAKNAMVFENAYCQGTWCRPSRISFMFGRYQDQTGVSLGQHLQRQGMHTARVGKIFHMRVPGDIIAGTDGVDHPECWTQRFNSPGPEAHTTGEYACLNSTVVTKDLANRQSTRMPHRMFVTVKADTDGTEQADYKSASKAIELLGRSGDQPFFLAVGMVRPHYPMVAPESDFQPYGIDRIEMPGNWKDDTRDMPKSGLAKTRNSKNSIGKYPDNQKRMWSGYYASVSFMDRQIGRILDALEKSPHRDNTAVVFTSDHGYHLGEHGFWQKSNLHEEVIRVPLIIDAPGMKAGRTSSLVELVDLFPTFCDLTQKSIPSHVQGASLQPILESPLETVRQDAISIHNGHSLRTARWHYIRYAKDGGEELYDVADDSAETTNLATDGKHQATLQSLRDRLDQRVHLIERKTH